MKRENSRTVEFNSSLAGIAVVAPGVYLASVICPPLALVALAGGAIFGFFARRAIEDKADAVFLEECDELAETLHKYQPRRRGATVRSSLLSAEDFGPLPVTRVHEYSFDKESEDDSFPPELAKMARSWDRLTRDEKFIVFDSMTQSQKERFTDFL